MNGRLGMAALLPARGGRDYKKDRKGRSARKWKSIDPLMRLAHCVGIVHAEERPSSRITLSLMADVVAEQRAPCGCDAEQVAGPVNVDSPESKSTI